MGTNILTGWRIMLRPMTPDDAAALVAAAGDGELWSLSVTVVPSQATMGTYIAKALEGLANGTAIPYVIVIRDSAQVVGTTRFWKIDRQNRKLEIGHTWISASWQRTFVNTECKYLLLAHAFETLQCIRVQFTTDEKNAQSRAAILRLGAKEEGIIRNERIMPDGRIRHSVRSSIIGSEWLSVKQALKSRLKLAGTPTTR